MPSATAQGGTPQQQRVPVGVHNTQGGAQPTSHFQGGSPAPISQVDPAMKFVMQQLLQQQQQNQVMMQQLMKSATSVVKKPTTLFSKYSGKLDTFPFFVMKLNSYKADPYFAGVTDWTDTQQGTRIKASASMTTCSVRWTAATFTSFWTSQNS